MEDKGANLRNSAPKEEPKANEDDALCIICFEKKKDSVFYKCGHLGKSLDLNRCDPDCAIWIFVQ
jgi:hypothetical protein